MLKRLALAGLLVLSAGPAMLRPASGQAVTPTVLKTLTATANYTIGSAPGGILGESGTKYDNVGATGAVTFTLPEPAPGLNFAFTVGAAQTVNITAPAGVNMTLGNITSSSTGDTISSSGVGSGIESIPRQPSSRPQPGLPASPLGNGSWTARPIISGQRRAPRLPPPKAGSP